MEFRYKEQLGVLVICADEKEQESIYEQLRGLGLKLKAVCV